MQLANPPKALILLVALICVTVLMALGKISPEAGLPVITAFGGYGIGNGVAARAGKAAEPVIGPRQHD